ncbi:hypothetical protein [Streptomyces varsoviensis]|uniref:hypothetical protein n=1 Tax=Streptomyces varsoviensis TaxID=67373 RepID=UPI003F4D22EF
MDRTRSTGPASTSARRPAFSGYAPNSGRPPKQPPLAPPPRGGRCPRDQTYFSFFPRAAGVVSSATERGRVFARHAALGADVMLDLPAGERTECTGLELVRTKPLPSPPEPVRSLGIGFIQRSMTRADERGGRRDLWLRALDRAGFGFDS